MPNDQQAAATAEPIPHVVPDGLTSIRCAGCGLGGPHARLLIPGDPKPQREVFPYAYCEACETLTFANAGFDPSHYYKADYYSHAAARPRGPKAFAKTVRNWLTLFGTEGLSNAVRARSEHPVLPTLRPIISGDIGRKIDERARWLDIGCGTGAVLLHDLRDLGFRDLTGADPFMHAETRAHGFWLLKSDGIDLGERFDVVMMHHSLEHVPDPAATLQQLHDILAPDGVLLVRIPLCGSEPWRRHGGEWGNLDAPRHLTLWSARGFQLAAERAGWNLRRTIFDAKGRSLWAGEARLLGASEHTEDVRGRFTPDQLAAFAAEIDTQNTNGTSDSAAFFLTH
ncbi:MAG: methyltransferase domain-containing protein [Phenylobacterium sp.]|uniref:class I SAM-dependent methyltransferase n=1 Tax=Phenylobacterium sp. TaxID=1871053 RepID=UPI0025F82719|nr:class I SAM-dependent methyltransferase [Phenylobacterium sp.]MBI1196754.1 methyltransferase domain-containing protein [Phenylobacterium sp.]